MIHLTPELKGDDVVTLSARASFLAPSSHSVLSGLLSAEDMAYSRLQEQMFSNFPKCESNG